MTIRQAVAALATLAALVPATIAQTPEPSSLAEFIRRTYTKFEYRIPMRDGVHLYTAVYTPNHAAEPLPFLMIRTPYACRPYGPDRYRRTLGPSEAFARDGYIFVYQDVRGRYQSEGVFVNMRPHQPVKHGPTDVDESTDTHDTIAWLLENVPGHNGRVGMWGISYPGFYCAAGVIDSHPALRAASPQAPIADWFVGDDMHHHGAFILPLAFNFFSSFGQPHHNPTTTRGERFDHGTKDGYQFFLDLGPLRNANERHFRGEIAFWNEVVAHPNYDEFWQSRNILPHLNNVGCAVMVVGGWYDTEDLYGPLSIYRSIEQRNPDAWNVLVMGPWSHGGWTRTRGRTLGTEDFGFDTSAGYDEHVAVPFFRHFLKDDAAPEVPEALVFETGANRWRSFDAWPPHERVEHALHFRAGGLLSPEAPVTGGEAFDDYVSDPSKPVPYTTEITTRWAKNYMTEDQRFAAWRPDVLVYQTEPLTEDLTLAGPIRADLWVSTTGSAADWIVKVIDAHPGENPNDADDADWPGHRQRLVRAEVMRGRFRNGYVTPEPFTPDEVTPVSFELRDVLHTFKRGHRLMVQVQSTWFPFVDRNPQRYVPNIFEATEDDFITATHRVHRTRAYPSRIVFGALPTVAPAPAARR
ncbi:MAG: CocE/NonD family hydrolase [Phycisphaerae bacterium]|nr:CocE/NonD family hydrolase [Phycisphaerae bacterium]